MVRFRKNDFFKWTQFMIIQVFSLGWKPIPSEARVTRDEVSGLKK